ncbi:MAG: SsrA-binding protein SmpB [Candidatus Kapabacteria bacterium]|nr:SsrA-binding protein SmpB [Candidatus Kapabacteria bacterium]
MKTLEIRERKQKLISANRRAYHDYEVVQKIETGIILTGTEVKSLRDGKVSLQDAYAAFQDKDSLELSMINLHISPYSHGNRENHEPKRLRKLLVNHREAIKLKTLIQEKGMTLIPLSIYFSGPFVKMEIGIVRAKRKYDKREDTKKREVEKEIRRKFV